MQLGTASAAAPSSSIPSSSRPTSKSGTSDGLLNQNIACELVVRRKNRSRCCGSGRLKKAYARGRFMCVSACTYMSPVDARKICRKDSSPVAQRRLDLLKSEYLHSFTRLPLMKADVSAPSLSLAAICDLSFSKALSSISSDRQAKKGAHIRTSGAAVGPRGSSPASAPPDRGGLQDITIC